MFVQMGEQTLNKAMMDDIVNGCSVLHLTGFLVKYE
jgi:hypothetical protein